MGMEARRVADSWQLIFSSSSDTVSSQTQVLYTGLILQNFFKGNI